MQVKELLKNFSGFNKIQVFDVHDLKKHNLSNAAQAITDFGFYEVRQWRVENNLVCITIQTQF